MQNVFIKNIEQLFAQKLVEKKYLLRLIQNDSI